VTFGLEKLSYRDRFALALAISIAIHEIAFGLGAFTRLEEPHPQETPMATAIIVQVRLKTPAPLATLAPTPRPTATPTPPPRATPAPKREVAAPRATMIAHHTGGSKGAPKLEVHLQKIAHHKESLPIWWAAPHGSKTVANLGNSTAGPSVGSGTGAGTGTGAGNQAGAGGGTGGTGSGMNAETPCGGPVFHGLRAKFNRSNGSFDEDVRVELRLANGQTLYGDFHYPWHYPSESDNPFSPNWKGGPNDAIPAQLPPPGFDVSKEPEAVQLTLKYTTPNGLTRFAPCPA
jgi:hypothetical protein